MKNNQIKVLLFFSILVMAILPMTAALYFLDHALQTSLDLGFNQEMVQALSTGSQNLKKLKILDPQNESTYRAEFERFEDLKYVYSNPEIVKGSVLDSLKIYFGLGSVAALLLSILLAGLLSRRIASSYEVTFKELLRHKDQVRYLEEISSWQELAKILAHEIKNPLTPIEILVSALSKAYHQNSQPEFEVQLAETQAIIGEEIGHLKDIVNRFSEFSRLPKVQLVSEDISEVIKQQVKALTTHFEDARFRIDVDEQSSGKKVKLDSALFRQVLVNLIRNGVEANPKMKVKFEIKLADQNDHVKIVISNDGVPVPKELCDRIFDPYISGKSGKDNMGLGLTIVKKIIIEHGGDIMYKEVSGHPSFQLSLVKAD